LSWSGIVRPAAIEVPQGAGMVIGAVGAAVALGCIFTFATIGRGTPAPFDPPRRLVIGVLAVSCGIRCTSVQDSRSQARRCSTSRCRFSAMLASSFSQRTSSWLATRSPLCGGPSAKSTRHTAARSGDGGRGYEPHMISPNLFPPARDYDDCSMRAMKSSMSPSVTRLEKAASSSSINQCCPRSSSLRSCSSLSRVAS
jgi:hypothetical protein